MESLRLSINVDHVATVRNARGTSYPDPVHLAVLALNAGAHGITAHLREDRRHIRERDVELLRAVSPRFNLELARVPEILAFAKKIQPDLVTLVPEKREELTTEGGLDVTADTAAIRAVVAELQEVGIPVSLFIDPEDGAIEAAASTGTRFVELHTGRFCDAEDEEVCCRELDAIAQAANKACELGLRVNAGHGLRLDNVGAVSSIPEIEELSIGHSIIGRALHVGMADAVSEMKEAMRA